MNLTIWKRIFTTQYGLPLGISILLQGALNALMLPLVPILITDKIGLDKTQVMLFFLISTVMGIVITLGTGWLSDGIVARYKLVLACGVVTAVGLVGISQATLPIHAYLAYVAIAANGVLFPQLFAVAKLGMVAGWEQEAQVMGITGLRTLFSLGYVLGTALSSLLAKVDIRMAFLLIAVAALLLTLLSTQILYRIEKFIVRQGLKASEHADAAIPVVVQQQLPIYALIVPLLALTILRGADSTRGVYLSLVMYQLFRDASIAPLMFGITAAVELVTMGLMGYLASKIGEKATIAIGALTGALYFAIMSFSQSLPLLYLAHALYAVFVAALLGVAMAYVQGLVANRAGLGGSLYMAIFSVGNLIGILLPVLVQDYDQSIFIAPIILCLVGAALLMFGDRTAQIAKRKLQTQVSLTTETQGVSR